MLAAGSSINHNFTFCLVEIVVFLLFLLQALGGQVVDEQLEQIEANQVRNDVIWHAIGSLDV